MGHKIPVQKNREDVGDYCDFVDFVVVVVGGGGGRTSVKTTKISMSLIKMKVIMVLMKVLKEGKMIKKK